MTTNGTDEPIVTLPRWQPIETAPKDGGEVLLISARGLIANGFWSASAHKVGFWVWPYLFHEPAHWMPLPTSPNKEIQS